ncbi:zinc finger CCHC domain-containing protein 8 isoform X1 [Salmo trutta]|uniref:zinc finger CCHC domain-containing protein 8 isoform X1 n=1 Tax=Salmo trutta TaxID=8032 RepID=UPI0011300F78|nr:zinc finger CCHC domain-containing protein 8 isoform X1 [Salmo trutta]
MAEVDFGDSELFEQLGESMPTATHIRFMEEEEDGEEGSELKGRLGECEETIRSLIEENHELKRKLKVLTRPSGINVENIKIDGPLLHILFANNNISKQCRQEIEDSICSIVQKHQQQGVVEKGNPYGNVNPQSSSFIMEEDQKTKTSCGIKKIKEAFSMVGSVLYFTSFCLDKLGQPLLNDNPQQTEGWEVPKYQQIFSQVIALDGQEVQMKEKRAKPCCFNCGLDGHQLRDCPQPKDMARINKKRKEFCHGNQGNLSNQRYHAEEVEERFAKYKPGFISEKLLSALGVDMDTLPPHIYRMRQLGYPPGWLKEAEMENSGLMLYDGKVSSDEEPEDNGQKISYDVSKLVDFPGFNISSPPSVKDDYRLYGSIPMQHNHMKQNFAAYLSNNFPMPGANCNKRQHESNSTPRQTKKRRSDARSSDMDFDSDQDTTPRRHRSSDSFQFQPPLPPGSPSFGSPPPLPHGTPPATPTPPPLPKGTPPPTPTNGSRALRGRTVGGIEESAGGEEEELTLEELEEQQRLIWAALENADTATNSDSETPAVGTPLPSSPSISTPAHVDAETEMEDGEAEDCEEKEGSIEAASHNSDEQISVETSSSKCQDYEEDAEDKGKVVEDKSSLLQSPDEEESPQSPEAATDRGNVLAQKARLLQTPVQQVSRQSDPSGQDAMEGDLSGSLGNVMAVPHRSKFAQGIIPFEDTPEFTEVAEATGTYLRIRDLLKGSPRNMAKIKK